MNSKYTCAQIEERLDNVPVDYVKPKSTSKGKVLVDKSEQEIYPVTYVSNVLDASGNSIQSQIGKVQWSNVSGKPTTVVGYGITDLKIENGTITIGNKSITPITTNMDVGGFATKSELNTKQDTISDLATIRSGAAKGATAVQPSAISDMETKAHALQTFVAKVNGKGLSTNDYTTADKDKLSGISSGAEVNVQSDWDVDDVTSDAFIKNKPTIPTVNNGTLTIQKNGTQVATFSANQSGNQIANITVPTKVSELENDINYLTKHQSLDDYATKQYVNSILSSSEYNLLKTYTLEQNVSVVFITEDEEGKGFMVKEAIVEIVYPSVGSRTIRCIPAQVVNGEPVNNLYGSLYVDVSASSTQLYWVCKFTRLGKKTYLKGCASNGYAISEIYYNGYNQNIQSDTEYIQAIGLTSTTTVPSGTIIKVYGR